METAEGCTNIECYIQTTNRSHRKTDFGFLFYWVCLEVYARHEGLPQWLSGKESVCNAGNLGLIPGLGRSRGAGHDNPLQYSCLEYNMDRGAKWAADHGVAKSRTQLKQLSTHARRTRSNS